MVFVNKRLSVLHRYPNLSIFIIFREDFVWKLAQGVYLFQSEINVTISADGALTLNRHPIKLQELEEGLRQLIEPNSESLVVINADERVVHGRVVTVMDRLRPVKGVRLAITAER